MCATEYLAGSIAAYARERGVSALLPPDTLTVKISLNQAIGRFTDYEHIGIGQPLYSGGDIGCFSERELLLPTTTSHSPNNNPGVDYPCMLLRLAHGWTLTSQGTPTVSSLTVRHRGRGERRDSRTI